MVECRLKELQGPLTLPKMLVAEVEPVSPSWSAVVDVVDEDEVELSPCVNMAGVVLEMFTVPALDLPPPTA